MPKPNYAFEKRQRELEKKRKKEAAAGLEAIVESKLLSSIAITAALIAIIAVIVDIQFNEIVDRAFAGTPCPIGGIGIAELEREALARLDASQAGRPVLENPGYVKWRKGGEPHETNGHVVDAMHELAAAHALRSAVRAEDGWNRYERFAGLVNSPTPGVRSLESLGARRGGCGGLVQVVSGGAGRVAEALSDAGRCGHEKGAPRSPFFRRQVLGLQGLCVLGGSGRNRTTDTPSTSLTA